MTQINQSGSSAAPKAFSTVKVTAPPRVRIAPSPTGDPHIGTAYMGLFNSVFAKKHGGTFVVRIEDTDQTRYRKMSEDMILKALKWVGIEWQEGPDVGGPYGPYRQSERLPMYREAAEELISKKEAYRCFCSSERLTQVREAQQAKKEQSGYDRHCRDLSESAVKEKLASGAPSTVRLKAPIGGQTVVHDCLRGDVSFENTQLDDMVLLKSDGFPTYHLASVVDDHHMKISHVIRGEEWLSSTPKHVLLYRAFGFEAPQFIHMPLLRNPDKSKISKRKNPTSILYYQRKGVLPETLRNFLGLMGWSMPDEREIFTTAEMVENFTFDRMSLGGPVFDLQKLDWLNGKYLRTLSDDQYLHALKEVTLGDEYLKKVIQLVKERVETLDGFVSYAHFFFGGDLNYVGSPLPPKGVESKKAAVILNELLDRFEALDEWNAKILHDTAEAYCKDSGNKTKDVFMTLRVAVTGTLQSPSLAETCEVIGKEIVRRRMRLAGEYLKKMPVPPPAS